MPKHTQQLGKWRIHPKVFWPASILIVLIVATSALFPTAVQSAFDGMQVVINRDLSWFYILSVAIILVGMVYLGFSRFGAIRLGPDHAKPEYDMVTWFAMLFSTGMGIGIMFFGVAEPVMHYLSPPTGEPGTMQAARQAMEITFFHWGLHAWAIYASVGLMLAYFGYRHGLPLTLRSALFPIIRERIYGNLGNAVDVFAIIGTVFGVATSLGFGVTQINAGLNYLFGVPMTPVYQAALVAIITAVASLSVATGLDKGIKILSQTNLWAAIILLLLVLGLGPTAELLKHFVENTGMYISGLVSKTFNLYAYQPKNEGWLGGWTLLYWAWWISWSPFVGMFIARISRGRTIREFIMGVLLVPTGFTLLWMTAFGNSAIDLIANGNQALADTIQADVSVAIFKFFEAFPLTQVLSFIGMVMVIIFFVTSADSGAFVADTLASGGSKKTPIMQRVFWSSLSGLCALVLLYAGGLKALQTLTLVTALPFAVVLLIALYGLLKALQVDDFKRQSQTVTNVAPALYRSGAAWEKRLKTIVHYPEHAQVLAFLNETIEPALKKLTQAFVEEGLDATFTRKGETVRLKVSFPDVADFIYDVRLKGYGHTEYEIEDENEDEGDQNTEYVRAEVFLREGGQDYDVMGWSAEQIIHDALDQYEKHLTFLRLVNTPRDL